MGKKDIMNFAGIWKDMPDKEIESLKKNIGMLRNKSTKEVVLLLVESGRISIGRASELLKCQKSPFEIAGSKKAISDHDQEHAQGRFLTTSIQDIHRLAEKHGIRLGATPEQQRKSEETMRKLVEEF